MIRKRNTEEDLKPVSFVDDDNDISADWPEDESFEELEELEEPDPDKGKDDG